MSKLFDASKIEIKEDVSNIDAILEYEEVLLSISKTLINYRNENHLTQKDLAKELHVNQAMISKLERGTYNPTIKLLFSISRNLTKTSNLFINMLKDIISNLYKSKNVNYTIYEIYKSNQVKDNIVYLRTNNQKDNGGMIYGEINNKCKFSING